MTRLGDLALKLEKYRYNIASALAWVIFGMIFGSMNISGSSLILFGILSYKFFWLLLVITDTGYKAYKEEVEKLKNLIKKAEHLEFFES